MEGKKILEGNWLEELLGIFYLRSDEVDLELWAIIPSYFYVYAPTSIALFLLVLWRAWIAVKRLRNEDPEVKANRKFRKEHKSTKKENLKLKKKIEKSSRQHHQTKKDRDARLNNLKIVIENLERKLSKQEEDIIDFGDQLDESEKEKDEIRSALFENVTEENSFIP